jgi:hypothetical protein
MIDRFLLLMNSSKRSAKKEARGSRENTIKTKHGEQEE